MRVSALFAWSILAGAIACNNIPDCDDPSTSQLIVQFTDTTFTTPKDEIFSVIRDAESGFVYYESDTIQQATLDVNPANNMTTFVFEGDESVDTLVVGYRPTQFLKSEDCGPVLAIFNLDIVAHTFEDTLLTNNELLRDVVNIQVVR